MQSQQELEDVDNAETSQKTKVNAKKEALMKLIAQEMISSLLGEENNDDDQDDDVVLQHLQEKLLTREKARKLTKKSKKKTRKTPHRQEDGIGSPSGTQESGVEDVYAMPPNPSTLASVGEDMEADIKDSDSFAAGHLHELVEDRHRKSSFSLGTSQNSGSHPESATNSTLSGSKDSTIRSRELSIEEIRQYVMDNIPAAVREQIPPEAWGQIFKGESMGSKTPSQQTKGSIERIRKQAIGEPPAPAAPVNEIFVSNEDDDIDDITVFSDVSGLTGAFPDGKYVEQRRESMSHMAAPLAKVDEASSQSSKANNSHRSFGASAPSAPGEAQAAFETESRRNSLANIYDIPVNRGNGPLKVTWDQVEVRYYERAVTDNPSVQSGPAIGIGWRYKRGGRVDVDYWEQARAPARHSVELVLPRHVREGLLREAGVTQKEMAEMVRVIAKSKHQRKQTVNNLSASGVEEAVENARRRVGRLLNLGRKKDIVRK